MPINHEWFLSSHDFLEQFLIVSADSVHELSGVILYFRIDWWLSLLILNGLRLLESSG
jgi:hypothetical protein